jgi:hypothetical protein
MRFFLEKRLKLSCYLNTTNHAQAQTHIFLLNINLLLHQGAAIVSHVH